MSIGPVAPSGYDEGRSAVNRPLVVWWCVVPLTLAALVCVALVITGSGLLIGIAAFAFAVYFTMAARYFYRNWPTGIRVDASGITIGAVGSRRARQRQPRVTRASWGLYMCPWEAVREVRVVTGKNELRALNREFRYTFTSASGGVYRMEFCDIGVLTAPCMRAALVAVIDQSQVTGTAVRPGRVSWLFPYQVSPRMSGTWIVPTRHPAALHEALNHYQVVGSEES